MKTIQYYIKEVYGRPLEYIVDEADARAVHFLTGQKTISQGVRDALSSVTGIKWEQVVAPVK